MLFSFRSLSILRFEECAEMAKNIFSILKADYNFMGRVERAIADRIIAEPDGIIKFTLISVITGVVRTTVVFWLPTYISQYLGYSTEQSALIYTASTMHWRR